VLHNSPILSAIWCLIVLLSYDWQNGSIPLVEDWWDLRNAASLLLYASLLAAVLYSWLRRQVSFSFFQFDRCMLCTRFLFLCYIRRESTARYSLRLIHAQLESTIKATAYIISFFWSILKRLGPRFHIFNHVATSIHLVFFPFYKYKKGIKVVIWKAFFSSLLPLLITFQLYIMQKALLWSAAVMVLSMLPASNLFFPCGFVVAERLLYLPRYKSIISSIIKNTFNLFCDVVWATAWL